MSEREDDLAEFDWLDDLDGYALNEPVERDVLDDLVAPDWLDDLVGYAFDESDEREALEARALDPFDLLARDTSDADARDTSDVRRLSRDLLRLLRFEPDKSDFRL